MTKGPDDTTGSPSGPQENEPDPRLRQIWLWVNGLRSHLLEPLPADISGNAIDGPLYPIKKCIEEIAGNFNLLQQRLGLEPGEKPRFYRVFENNNEE